MKYSYLLAIVCLFLSSCDGPSSPFPPVQDIGEFPSTLMVATMEEEVDWTQNILYCPTLLYAWQGIKDTLPEPLTIDKELPLQALNDSRGYVGALEEGEYELTITVEELFIKAEVFFRANLLLETPLYKNPISLTFDEQQVTCFGGYGEDTAVTNQVVVLFYESEEEFAVAITPKDKSQELILYKTKETKRRSLEALYEALAQKKARYGREEPPKKNAWIEEDILAVPNLSFNINKNYQELIGSSFLADTTSFEITKATQRIALALDRTGALVESEAEIELTKSAEPESIQTRQPLRLVFDADFLLVAKKKVAENPYLLVWVSTPAFMN